MTISKGLCISPLSCCQWISGAKGVAASLIVKSVTQDPGQILYSSWWVCILSAPMGVQCEWLIKAGVINAAIKSGEK